MGKLSLPGRSPSRHCTTMAAISSPLGFSTGETRTRRPFQPRHSERDVPILSPAFSGHENDDSFFRPISQYGLRRDSQCPGCQPIRPRTRPHESLGLSKYPDISCPRNNYAAWRSGTLRLVRHEFKLIPGRGRRQLKGPGIRYFAAESGFRQLAQSFPQSANTAGSTINGDALVEGYETYGEGCLCHSVAGCKCTWLKPAWLQNFGKLRQGG